MILRKSVFSSFTPIACLCMHAKSPSSRAAAAASMGAASTTWTRSFASAKTSTTPTPVTLAFDKHAAPSGSTSDKGPLVILHGLFGSKQNWRSLSRSLAQRTGRDVFALDLRNHGDSPHDPGTTYTHYARDISEFLKAQKLENVVLMGHSMGGKVAMAHALSDPDSLDKLIVVDMSPAKGKISEEFANYIDGMREVDAARVSSKKDADVLLQKYEPALPIRQFLLTNLTQKSREEPFRIRLPLDILLDSIGEIGDFPYAPEDGATFAKPTLFVKGGDSKYINRKNIPTAQSIFPNSRLEIIDGAGHWVHSEKPKQFVDLVTEFCAQ